MYKLGFIGFGNMATAIAKGILKEGIVSPHLIYVYDINEHARQNAANCGFNTVKCERDAVKNADIIFLCVKPQGFTRVLDSIKDIAIDKTFLSIAAGISMQKISLVLGNVAIVRAMPNTPLLMASGTTALTMNEIVTPRIFAFIKEIFNSVGSVYALQESKFNEVINVNGSTPAYIYYFAKIITDYAMENGIEQNLAMNMLCDTLVGSALMLTNSGKTAQELIDMVTSKGGTTIAALDKFKETGFEESLRAGMGAALARAVELGNIE